MSYIIIHIITISIYIYIHIQTCILSAPSSKVLFFYFTWTSMVLTPISNACIYKPKYSEKKLRLVVTCVSMCYCHTRFTPHIILLSYHSNNKLMSRGAVIFIENKNNYKLMMARYRAYNEFIHIYIYYSTSRRVFLCCY